MRIISIVLIIAISLCLISVNLVATENKYYATLKGKLRITGSEPFVKLMLISSADEVYSLSGDLATELRKIPDSVVRVTGEVSESTLPRASGDINVKNYTLIDPGYNQQAEWALGKIHDSKEGFVLVGEDQIIYSLINASDLNLSKYENSKILLIGDVEFHGDYCAEMKVEGYKILKEN